MLTNSSARLSWLILLPLVGVSLWSIHLIRPPLAKPATAPPTEFSAERAMRHVRQIAREPHAVGTPGHARVRAYLLDALRELGLQPQVQETVVTRQVTGARSFPSTGAALGVSSRAAYVYNVMARIPGTRPGRALLLMAHYDSQPSTPGAADDGSSVAAILETARAIRQGAPLQHDVILLFTDGEETGLFGARAFLRHPWASDVGFVINLEARGNSGPSLFFEMSEQNGWIVEQLARAVPNAMATSLMYEIYRSLPNSTDYTIFREVGYAGINAAFLDGFVHYHKMTDSPENLNQNSMQHQGGNVLALTRHLGDVPLDRIRAPDRVFFNGAGDWFIQYPMGLNWLWISLLTGLFGAALVVGRRRRELTIGQTLSGLALSLLVLLLIGGFSAGAAWLIAKALPYWHFINGTYSSGTFFVAFALLTIGMFGVSVWVTLRWLKPLSLVMGAFGLIYVLTVTLFILLPGGVYLLAFPMLGALTGLVLVLWQTRQRPEIHAAMLMIAALPTVFILVPTASFMFVTFDLQLPVAAVTLLLLTLFLLLPLWLKMEHGLRWRNVPMLPLTALLAGVVTSAVGIQNEAPTADTPLHTVTSYHLNADTKRAFWTSYYFDKPDPWNRQFFPNPTFGKLTEVYPNGHIDAWNHYLKNPAPAVAAPPPVAEIQSDVTTGPVRRLTLRLRSPRGASNLEAVLFAGGADRVRKVAVNGEPIPIQAEQTALGPAFDVMLYGLPVSKTVTMTIDMTAGNALRLLLYDHVIGLPTELIKTPRPAWAVPEQGRRSNVTVIVKTFLF